jgi:hypothetical protein
MARQVIWRRYNAVFLYSGVTVADHLPMTGITSGLTVKTVSLNELKYHLFKEYKSLCFVRSPKSRIGLIIGRNQDEMC